MSRPFESLTRMTTIKISQNMEFCARQIRLNYQNAGLSEIPDNRTKAIELALEELNHLIDYEIKNPGTIPFKNKTVED